MIGIKVNKGCVKAKIKISGRLENLAEFTITMVALGEGLNQEIEKNPEFGRKVKTDCIKAFTMAANGSSRAEIAEAITGRNE